MYRRSRDGDTADEDRVQCTPVSTVLLARGLITLRNAKLHAVGIPIQESNDCLEKIRFAR